MLVEEEYYLYAKLSHYHNYKLNPTGGYMYSIKKLCKASGLSRSTLLYYDSIGLLKPSERTNANYRVYSEKDKTKLEQICLYREAGVPLEQIKSILDSENTDDQDVLSKRLAGINNEIYLLRIQQKIIVEMLKKKQPSDPICMLDRDVFVSLLKSSGADEQTLDQLHVEFEKRSPNEHQAFLEFLGIPEEDIRYIRTCAKAGVDS